VTDFIIEKFPLASVSEAPFVSFASSPLVAILLCTYNGARFLTTQLESIESQTHENWFVVASDDGSSDQTLGILQEYQSKWPFGKLIIRSGPQKGFCQNFLSLGCDPNILAEFYAFCDQDDVWLPTKLTIALENITNNQESNEPYLYCGCTTYVDEGLQKVGASPLFSFPLTFRNALVQSIAGGNTMVFNRKTKELLEKAGRVDHTAHDWWLYQLVTGAAGVVFYDPKSQVLYRQHKDALIGGGNSFLAKIERINMLRKGRFRVWNAMNIQALQQIGSMISRENRAVLRIFETLRRAGLRDRVRLTMVSGIYRQTRRGTISLYIAMLFKKI